MAGGKKLVAAVLLSMFVGVLSGRAVKCTVSHDDGRTTYALQDVSYDKDAQKPEFSWFNISKYVIANHVDHIDVVISRDFNSLTARACIENLFCEGHINSKGKPVDYTANCTTVCPPQPLPGDRGMLRHWIAVIVIVIVLVCTITMIFLCCKYKNLRRCYCGQTRGFYTVGKKDQPKAEDV